MHIDNQSIQKIIFDRICKVHLSDENKILIDKFALERSFRITGEGSVPEMRIWSILYINSDIKWCTCIHLSRSLFI